MKEIVETGLDDPDLAITEELLSLHAINPFLSTISAPRSIMTTLHLGGIVTIETGKPQIVQTGLEMQLAENTFRKEITAESRVLGIIKRYNGVSANTVSDTTEYSVIIQNVETLELDVINIPRYHKLHPTFGFKYNVNEEVFNSSILGRKLPKGTIFADSPTVSKDGEYAFGNPLNVAIVNEPEVTGDGVIFSKSACERYAFRTYETIVIECGEKSYLLDKYGKDGIYQAYPNIGERVNDDRVVAAVRDYENELSPALLSRTDVKTHSVNFDKPFYARATGGVVSDIKVYHNDKSKKSTYTQTNDQSDRYAGALKQYYSDIIGIYAEHAKKHFGMYGTDIPVSPNFHRMLLDAYAITERERNIRFTYKNDLVDTYRIEIVLEYYTIPGKGYKITTLHGNKGIIVAVREDHLMPVDVNGIRADMIMDPTSIPGRMTASCLYEQFFSAVSRRIKLLASTRIDGYGGVDKLTDGMVNEIFTIILKGVNIFGTEQYYGYVNFNTQLQRTVIHDVYYNECYVYYKVSSKLKPYEVVIRSLGTEYEPVNCKFNITSTGELKISENNIIIAPLYIILLAKTPEHYLATSSAKTNHFDLPISVGPKQRQNIPYRNSPTKILSETESRLYPSYAGREALAELKDRANSVETLTIQYTNLLNSDTPTDVVTLVDRKVHPFGTDKALEITEAILNVSGIETMYVKEVV